MDSLLGTGASTGDLGGLLVGQLWKLFCDEYSDSHKWLVENEFIEEGEMPNVEEFADTLEIARIEWERADNDELGELEAAQHDFKRCVVRAAVLNEGWLKKPEEIAEFPPELGDHRRLLQRVVGARQPGHGESLKTLALRVL